MMDHLLTSFPGGLILPLSLVLFLILRFFRASSRSMDYPGPVAKSPTVFGRKGNEDKVPPIFPNGWYALKESIDVPVGKAVYVQALGEHFVVFRGENGVVSVTDAWCPHLGANLGFGGTVVGNCIRCPFHHWTFDGESGECTSVPYAEKIPLIAKLKVRKSVEVTGCIFVWYHADNEEPTWFPKPLKEIENKEIVMMSKSFHTCKSHIQDIHENVADSAHFLYLHRPGLWSGHKVGFYESFWNRIMWLHFEEVDWVPSDDESTKHEACATIKQSMTLFSHFKTKPQETKVRQFGPGFAYTIMEVEGVGKLVLEIFYLPIEPMRVASVIRTYGPPNFQSIIYTPFVQKFVNVMSLRDSGILEEKCFLEKPLLVKGEKIAQFRRWFSQFYSKSSPRLSNGSNSLQW